MSPSNDPELDQLAAVERIIAALHLLESECTARELKHLARHIGDCAAKCEDEYIAFHRRLYKSGGGKPPPPETEH